jgi:hypothetical protein
MLPSEVRRYAAAIAALKPTTGSPHMRSGGVGIKSCGAYIYDGVLFFQFKTRNSSAIPYDLDFCRFYIRDIKSAKRSTAMEKEITPRYVYHHLTTPQGTGQQSVIVAAFDKFTISEKKVFMAEFFEASGDRHLQLRLKGKHLLKARPLLPLSQDKQTGADTHGQDSDSGWAR